MKTLRLLRAVLIGVTLAAKPTPSRAQLPLDAATGAPGSLDPVIVSPTLRPPLRTGLLPGQGGPVRGGIIAARSTADAGSGSKPADTGTSRRVITSLTVQTFHFPVGRDVPDGDFSGLADSRVLPFYGAAIRSLSLSLTLTPVGEGGFLGDLYATLVHENGGYAVLLNRPGRQPGNPFGYSDDVPISVTFTDEAPFDIHEYRLHLNGTHGRPVTTSLTGLWQPDGRAVDPLLVVSGDTRESLLASFLADEVGGRWTLYAADLGSGGQYRLDSWTLAVTFVPEPAQAFGLLALCGLAWVLCQRGKRPES